MRFLDRRSLVELRGGAAPGRGPAGVQRGKKVADGQPSRLNDDLAVRTHRSASAAGPKALTYFPVTVAELSGGTPREAQYVRIAEGLRDPPVYA